MENDEKIRLYDSDTVLYSFTNIDGNRMIFSDGEVYYSGEDRWHYVYMDVYLMRF